MTLVAALEWVQHTALSTSIRQSDWGVMDLEAVHLIGLALFGGSVTIVALAALHRDGLGGLSLETLTRGLVPLTLVGFALMLASGTLIALSMPFKYYLNPAFRWKMALLLPALASTSSLMLSVPASADGSARVARHPGARRALALLAFLLWLGVGFCGRLIGFL